MFFKLSLFDHLQWGAIVWSLDGTWPNILKKKNKSNLPFFLFFCLAKTCFKYSSSHSKIEPGQWIAHQFGLTDDHEWTAKLDWWTQLWSHWDVYIRSLRMSTFQCSNEIALTLSLIKTIVISTNRWAGSSSPPRFNHQVQKCKIIKYKNTIIQKCED